ncbi:alpha/beta fold hydrolase [Mycolicibacterium brumae]|uniref:Alpha/beta hydrolase n=1 Tax=Mycolicibacterium brumae TaxID=85968 RepID=A0A2G5P5N8_9MYCO|nr:alpha/beta fold hydrolase [Mycolicibacterium brumae]MCV7192202.1 alpha/beta fold hydrolase [Mycolicibacterium brumae]PIB73577.1 alpha/beta hydrolase [Mycolicibacterium brumae]RWA21259.1 hypothetical protein MBRU_15050 [Mycolicibacterium brumae DSM 44177]UWW07027.1 alpha/beta fold hydrolase [Mycolicibacterium brumae]
MEQYRRGDLVFDVLDRGPDDGPPVILLHGFPQFNTSWNPIMDRLVAQGYRCLAPNQRGYSPGARPLRRRDYTADQLADDVIGLIDTIGAPKAHLVGHDWGAAVAWAVAGRAPGRLASLTALSVPHNAAFLKAMVTSKQGLASWYMLAFQLPKLPERFLRGRAGQKFLAEYGGQLPEFAERDMATMAQTGALTAALNWYRALPFSDFRQARTRITVPTMYIWSNKDKALMERGGRDTARFVDADYRYEILHGVTHWMVDQVPDTIADMLLEWFAAHPS